MALPLSVIRKEPQLIRPAEPTPHELKQLSQLDDQKDLYFHFPMAMYYKNNPLMEGTDPVAKIKEAVSDALIYYYPLAGRLVEGSNGKVVLDCSGQGILFVEAEANVTLEMFGDSIQPPCPYAGEILLGVNESQKILNFPLMLIQVTRFTCGGFAVAVRLNHMMADSVGLVSFLECVAAIARGVTLTVLPVWCRELVQSRNPPKVSFVHREYEEDPDEATKLMHRQNIVRQSVFLSIKDIKALRNRLPPYFQKSSMFEIVTACAWIARTLALEIDPNEIVKLICVVSARGKDQFNLPDGYYGNALVFPAAISKAGVLCQSPLGYALQLIQKAKAQVNEEYVRSVLDLLAYNKGQLSIDNSWNFVASDTSRAGFTEVDFGWGKPIYGGPPVGAISFYTSAYARFKNSKGEVGMVVPMCLQPQAMVRFREELFKIIHSPQKSLHPSML
ncbi:methanol O-anthraniloyltransferase-like [Heracleum sosnowskyi]|uniref:Methanol O-anthraniloyltransferase-like n=1 Tax=Heracleum sosnowskyi TaxID=360622 RepID=A0AAD8H8V0_9APIA|nr:methanol O-anthraniloyltransferase-like [Heracleum sosnowskyi]